MYGLRNSKPVSDSRSSALGGIILRAIDAFVIGAIQRNDQRCFRIRGEK